MTWLDMSTKSNWILYIEFFWFGQQIKISWLDLIIFDCDHSILIFKFQMTDQKWLG
jgi:hypothetical protein